MTRSKANELTDIYALGDSYVEGYGVSRQDCWVHLLGEKLNKRIINRGRNGALITELAVERHPLEKEDVLLILGGCNDFLNGISVDRVIAAYDHLQFMAKNRGAESILIVPPMPEIVEDDLFVGMSLMVSLREKMKELNDRVDGLHLDQFIPRAEGMYIDGIHLVEEGHRRIADAVYNFGKEENIF